VRKFIGALAVISLAAHLMCLPQTLEDLDSVNFALGVRSFDVAQHQPHPPGYPVFIALGKLGTWVFRATGSPFAAARGLALWSAVAAGVLPLLLFAFFRGIDGDARRAAIATLLAICAPLVWFSGVRPLSDMAGLAAAFAALAALVPALRASPSPSSSTPRSLIVGAFLAGLSIGFRSQMALLTMPVLAVVIATERARAIKLVTAAAVGVAVWAIPLVLLNGGIGGYLHALGSQAGEDFSGVVMLWTHRTVRVALAVFLQTFVRPWDSPILGGIMIVLAAAGAGVLAFRSWRALAVVLIAFGPYAVFHIVFQETVTLRYALPIMPLVAYLAAVVLSEADRRAAFVAAGALAGVSLAAAAPATAAFARTPSPIFGVLSEMRLLQQRGASPIVGMHRRVFTESRRARVFDGEVPGTLLPAPRDFEWLELTRTWREQQADEAWFVADPRRTDLALIDLAHTRTRQYRWPMKGAVYVGGARPDELDWHIITDPGWFLEHGWSLTPETAGIADREGWGPHRRPSVGWIKRRSTEATMMIGGRHLGAGQPVRIVARIDDRPVSTFDAQPGYFLRFVDLPAGSLTGDGKYAKLTVSAESTEGGPVPPVGIEQFNLQDNDRVQYGFDEGWFEPEYNPATARSWRWMSTKAIVSVRGGGRGVTMRVGGESPLRYFPSAPLVRVSAGDRVLAEWRPAADFTFDVRIPGDLLAAAQGRIVITSDRDFVAGEREGTADRRRLAVRIYRLSIE
jgi:hypothetical protein